MWSMDVCWKAWHLRWSGGSSPSPREEGSSLRSGLRRSKQSRRDMESISRRCTTPKVQWNLCCLGKVALIVEQFQAREDDLFYRIHRGRQNFVRYDFVGMFGQAFF